jgi:hypothetical protein
MQSQISAINNRQQLNRKIDHLQKVTAALLNEVKSIRQMIWKSKKESILKKRLQILKSI